MKTSKLALSIVTGLVALFAFGCRTKPIEELASKNSNREDIIECRQFDKLMKTRLMTCNEDTDCYDLPMPRAADCYVPFSGNIAETEKMRVASKKCGDLYRDETYCEAPTPSHPVCRKGRCQMQAM